MEKNIDTFREPLDLSLTIETWLKKVMECQEYALEGGDPISDVGMVNNGYNRFHGTHAFVDNCKKWKDRTNATKTWAEFVIFFTKSYNEYADSPESLRTTGIANNAEQLHNNQEELKLVATVLQEHEQSIANQHARYD